MKKKLILLIIMLCAITAIVIVKSDKKDPNILELYGNIEIRQVDLGFRVEGKISKMIAEEGDYVKKGQLLAILDDVIYKSNYEKSIADVDRNKSLKNDAESTYRRNLPLCSDGTTSKQQCDNYLNSKNASAAQLQSSIAVAKSAKKNLSDTRIYAPDNGVIMTRVQEPGASITPSQVVYTMAKTKPVWVRAYVTETDLGNIKYGMKAKVFTDSTDPKTGKKREYTGQIGYISPVAEFTPKTVQTTDLRTNLVYRVRIYIDNIDGFLRQGMPVSIAINLVNDDKK